MREQIIKIKTEHPEYGYKKIAKILGCASSTVKYHLDPKAKSDSINRRKKWINKHPFLKKMDNFKYRKNLTSKVRDFQRRNNGPMSPKAKITFTLDDVIKKFGENPKCYITGDPIDILKPETYCFDHIQASSKGGENSIDNLALASSQANTAKQDLSLSELFDFCKKVLIYNNIKI